MLCKTEAVSVGQLLQKHVEAKLRLLHLVKQDSEVKDYLEYIGQKAKVIETILDFVVGALHNSHDRNEVPE